jgi:MFS family permease
MSATAAAQRPIRSTIPARLDRLGWSPFHTRMVCGLGAAWILDGLQITIASSVTGVLSSPDTLNMTSTEIGLIASVYLVGEIIGALVFGRLSDQLGRRRLLVMTLLLYLLGTGAAALTTGHHHGWLLYFYATRLVAGMGIGGQYAAINSAIDEMMPSRYRGRVDIWINGSYWAGAILGSFASLVFLNAFAVNVGWRLAFLMGPVLALVVLVVARTLPESPRWLLTHGRVREAEDELAKIEEMARRSGEPLEEVAEDAAITLVPEKQYGYLNFLRLVFRQYPKRAILGASLMLTQSFLYNAIFFTYALMLTSFYGVSATKVPFYGLAFSVGNLVGAAIMILGGVVELLGINAEGESLEDVTKPLTAADQTSTVRPAPATTAAEA